MRMKNEYWRSRERQRELSIGRMKRAACSVYKSPLIFAGWRLKQLVNPSDTVKDIVK